MFYCIRIIFFSSVSFASNSGTLFVLLVFILKILPLFLVSVLWYSISTLVFCNPSFFIYWISDTFLCFIFEFYPWHYFFYTFINTFLFPNLHLRLFPALVISDIFYLNIFFTTIVTNRYLLQNNQRKTSFQINQRHDKRPKYCSARKRVAIVWIVFLIRLLTIHMQLQESQRFGRKPFSLDNEKPRSHFLNSILLD